MKNTIHRRQFIKTVAAGTVASYFAPSLMFNPTRVSADASKSRVIRASHHHLVDSNEKIDQNVVKTVVDETMISLTGTASVRDAWMKIFPRLQSTDLIGIKINCNNNRALVTHSEVVYAIGHGLSGSLGFNPNNVIIWDRSDDELVRAGYTINKSAKGIRCFGTLVKRGGWGGHRSSNRGGHGNSPHGNPHAANMGGGERSRHANPQTADVGGGGIGYDMSTPIDVGDGIQVHLSKMVTEMCTYLINVPVLKDSMLAGVTLGLKNYFGAIDRPFSCHRKAGDPYIANLYNLDPIKEKTRLVLGDAVFGCYDGGPFAPPQWISGNLLASTDPVALDYVGMMLIDQQREKRNLTPVALRTKYLRTAGNLGLGNHDPQMIDVVEAQL
jgi:uncharacterized protein (DUF362 family)